MTARTSAHLSYEFDDYYHELIRLRGEAEARQYFQSQKAAVDRIEEIAEREKHDAPDRVIAGSATSRGHVIPRAD